MGLLLPDLPRDIFGILSSYLDCFSQGRIIQTGCHRLVQKVALTTRTFTYWSNQSLVRHRKDSWPTLVNQMLNLTHLRVRVRANEIFSPFYFSPDKLRGIPPSVMNLELCLQNLPFTCYGSMTQQPTNYPGNYWNADRYRFYSPHYLHEPDGQAWADLDLSELCARPNLQRLRISGWTSTYSDYRVITPSIQSGSWISQLYELRIGGAWLNFEQFNALPQSLTKLKCGLLDTCNKQTVSFPPHLVELSLRMNNVSLVDKLPTGLLALSINQQKWDPDFDTKEVLDVFWATPLPPCLTRLRLNVDYYSSHHVTNIPASVIDFQYDGVATSSDVGLQSRSFDTSD